MESLHFRKVSNVVSVLHLKICFHLVQCKHLNCLGKKNYSRVTPSIRKWSRLFVVITLPFLFFSEVKFFGRCSVRHMLNYFHLCVFLMTVSGYARAQVIVLNQTL